MPQRRRILGIDPGFGRVGWGVIDVIRGVAKPVAAGCIETNHKHSFSERLVEIGQEIETILVKFKPGEVAIEELFFAKNVTTALQVAHARGVILYTLTKHHLYPREFTPLQVKQAVSGYGRADKTQIQELVLMHLGLKKMKLQDDAGDALAIALTAISEDKTAHI